MTTKAVKSKKINTPDLIEDLYSEIGSAFDKLPAIFRRQIIASGSHSLRMNDPKLGDLLNKKVK